MPGRTDHRSQEILGSVKSTAAAEVWDAGVLTAPALPLGSGAASLLAIPLELRLVSQLLLLLL